MSDYIKRGTAAYDEVVRILGNQAGHVLDESVRQINNRWLKATFFVVNGKVVFDLETGKFETKNRRVRIPKNSFLAKGIR